MSVKQFDELMKSTLTKWLSFFFVIFSSQRFVAKKDNFSLLRFSISLGYDFEIEHHKSFKIIHLHEFDIFPRNK